METTTLATVMGCSDTALIIANALELHHMRKLGSTSKQLHETTSTGILKELDRKMTERNTKAERLPNGTHRLHSRLGVHTLDVAVSPTICLIFPDFHKDPFKTQLPGTFNPVLLVTLDSTPYIGRIWGGSNYWLINPAPWPSVHDAMTIHTTDSLFRSEATILQNLLGGVWIDTVNHGVTMNGMDRTCTTVHLTLDAAAEGKQHRLQLICTPMPTAETPPKEEVDHALSTLTAQIPRVEVLQSGAFRLRSPDGKHTLVATVSTIVAQFFTDLRMDPFNPMLVINLDGAPYVARVRPGNNPAQWAPAQDFVRTGFASGLFRLNATILQKLAGGAWISRVDHNVPWRGTNHPSTHTTVHLVLDKTFVVVDGGKYNLQLVLCAVARQRVRRSKRVGFAAAMCGSSDLQSI